MNKLVKYELGTGAGVSEGADSGQVVLGDSFPSTTSTAMRGVCADRSGNLYLADSEQECIYKVTESGNVYLFAGSPGMQGYENGKGTEARFNQPVGICSDKSGNVYVADQSNGRVRKISDGGEVTTLAGGFNAPTDVAVCPNGDVIVCDQGDHKIYRVESGGRSFEVAGGTQGDVAGEVGGEKVKGNDARFNSPSSVSVNQYGDIYVADQHNFKIKKITPDGWVVRVTGGAQGNVNGTSITSRLAGPHQIECNYTSHNSIYIIDNVAARDRLKRVDQNGNVTTVSYPDSDLVRAIAVSPADKLFAVISEDFVHENQFSSSSDSSSEDSESSQSISESSQSESSQSISESSQSESSQSESSQSISESSSSESSQTEDVSSSSWSTEAPFESSSSSTT